MKKYIVIVIASILLAGCGSPVSHRAMLELQAKYPEYELWEQPMVRADCIFMRNKKDGSVVYTLLNSRDDRLHAVFGPLK